MVYLLLGGLKIGVILGAVLTGFILGVIFTGMILSRDKEPEESYSPKKNYSAYPAPNSTSGYDPKFAPPSSVCNFDTFPKSAEFVPKNTSRWGLPSSPSSN